MDRMLAVEDMLVARRVAAELRVGLVAGQSTLQGSYSTQPLKLLTPVSRGTSVWSYLSNLGGGLVAGDQTEIRCHIGRDARCFLGTQSSTKIYRNPKGRPCRHVAEVALEEGALLVLAPDPVQAFAEASYDQTQRIRMAPGASLVLLDWFTSGRMARGERWRFQRLHSRNEVWSRSPEGRDEDGRLSFLDAMTLDASRHSLDVSHRLGRFNCIALLLLMGPLVQTGVDALLESVAASPVSPAASLCLSASPVGQGALLRIAGERTRDVSQELERRLAFIPALLGDDPWARRF